LRITEREAQLSATTTRLGVAEKELAEERLEHVRTTSERDSLKMSIEQMRRDREESEGTLKSEFRNLAQEILTEHQHNLRQTNRDSIDLLLKPFKDNITEFRERVERIYAQENEQRGALKNELDNLLKLNQQMTSSAANLTDALKGNSKVQGDWGEVYLETILETTGLVRGIHYHVQHNLKTEEGANVRPDVILSLPEDRHIIIDSKVSLTDYVRYVEAESEAERRKAMAAHVDSVRKHVQELSSKGYERLVSSPDFVVMFIPTEPAFLEALKADSKIWSDAYARKVIISSPTNLFALLKMVGDMWRRDVQSKNQAEIVDKATKLYEQLVVFTEQLEGVGTALDTAKSKYDEAYKRLHTGNNNIVRLGERLKKLGLPTKKQQSAKSLAAADVDLEQE
jgi:DNA recombination protein RmuC